MALTGIVVTAFRILDNYARGRIGRNNLGGASGSFSPFSTNSLARRSTFDLNDTGVTGPCLSRRDDTHIVRTPAPVPAYWFS
jgi:hypothetical protein